MAMNSIPHAPAPVMRLYEVESDLAGMDMRAQNHDMLFTQRANKVTNLENLSGVKTDGRLIQNDNIRIAEQGCGQSYALPIAFGQRANQVILLSDQAGLVHRLYHLL